LIHILKFCAINTFVIQIFKYVVFEVLLFLVCSLTIFTNVSKKEVGDNLYFCHILMYENGGDRKCCMLHTKLEKI
jgi:hypothetical protein